MIILLIGQWKSICFLNDFLSYQAYLTDREWIQKSWIEYCEKLARHFLSKLFTPNKYVKSTLN